MPHFIPTLFSKVDTGAAFVEFAAGMANTVLCCIIHQGLPIGHILCYTFTYEE